MIKSLRRKIILSIMLIIGSFEIIFALCLSYYSIHEYAKNLYMSMESQIREGHTPPEKEETRPNSPTLKMSLTTIKVTSDGQNTTLTNELNLSQSDIEYIVDYALTTDKTQGEIKNKGVIFVKTHTQNETQIALSDRKNLTSQITRVCLTALVISVVFLGLVLLISIWVSSIVARPVQNALDQQKRFVADASHELKTPLAVISANNRIIQKTASKAQLDWIESTNEEINYMNKIIGEMLTLAQTEAVAVAHKTDVNLTKLATSLGLQFEPVAYEKNIKLNLNIASDLIVHFDEKMLRQIVMILLDNAIKYERSGGTVTLTATLRNSVCLSVNNRLSTIPAESLPHIFERFYKVDPARTTEGFGLGLSIAQNLSKLNNSIITATSDPQNGTTFEISFAP